MYFRLLLIALTFLAIFALFYLLFGNRPSPRATKPEPPAQVHNENYFAREQYS